jgi:hypothetical protein
VRGPVLSLEQEVIMGSATERRNCRFFGEQHPNSKLTREQVIQIRKEMEVPGTSRAWLAKRHGVSRTTIDNVVRGFTWREAL